MCNLISTREDSTNIYQLWGATIAPYITLSSLKSSFAFCDREAFPILLVEADNIQLHPKLKERPRQ